MATVNAVVGLHVPTASVAFVLQLLSFQVHVRNRSWHDKDYFDSSFCQSCRHRMLLSHLQCLICFSNVWIEATGGTLSIPAAILERRDPV